MAQKKKRNELVEAFVAPNKVLKKASKDGKKFGKWLDGLGRQNWFKSKRK